MKIKEYQVKAGDIVIDVVHKDIKNLRLSVHPPEGKVKIAAPRQMKISVIREFAVSKLDWIKKHQARILNFQQNLQQVSVAPDILLYNGIEYKLNIIERDSPPDMVLHDKTIDLIIRPGTSTGLRDAIIKNWYHYMLSKTIDGLLKKWEPVIGVKANEFGVRMMKTRWGSCNTRAKRIWLNLELAKKPPECLEYVVVHELVHLLERSHNARFKGFMDKFMPQWRIYREELNRWSPGQKGWEY